MSEIVELVRHAAKTGEVKNLSKVKKETLVAAIVYIAPKITDPTLHAELVRELTTLSTDEEDIFSDTLTTQAGSSTEQQSTPNTEEANTQSQDDFTVVTRKKKVCRHSWKGAPCTLEDCKFEHPTICNRAPCNPVRDPECPNFHPRYKKKNGNKHGVAKNQGNEKRRDAPPSKHKRSKPPTYRELRARATEMELRLLKMEVSKQKHLAKAKKLPVKAPTYAQAASRAVTQASMASLPPSPPTLPSTQSACVPAPVSPQGLDLESMIRRIASEVMAAMRH